MYECVEYTPEGTDCYLSIGIFFPVSLVFALSGAVVGNIPVLGPLVSGHFGVTLTPMHKMLGFTVRGFRKRLKFLSDF